MQLALRPYVTTGIALVGASVIAISPISPVTPDIHVPTINVSSAAVQLAAIANPAADPFTVWGEVLGSTFQNVVGMAGQVLGSGAPVLTQILANQVGYANQIGTGVKNTLLGLYYWQGNNQWMLDYADSLLKAGQVGDAMTYYIYALAGAAYAFYPVIGLFSIPGAIALNFGDALSVLPRAVQMLGVGGVLGLIEGPALAFANQVQTLINTTSTGDLLGAVNTVLNTPAVMVDAFLNGFTFAGMLSPFASELSTGLLGALLIGVPKMIADAIKPPAPPAPPVAVQSAPDTLVADVSSMSSISSTAISAIGGAGTITLSPATETTAAETPAAETPATETPVQETPATETPVQETPVEETPAAETPVEETPATETPVEETPVDKTPVDTEPSVDEDDDTAGSGSGATDLSGGNKVTPGQTHTGTTKPNTGSETATEPTTPTKTETSTTTGGTSAGTSTDSGSSAGNDKDNGSGADKDSGSDD